MANGGYKAINEIGPGDFVMAHDLETGEWRAQEVLDQWSHLDDGHMATVTINDGSEVTATDHHLFWVDNDQAWVELDQVEPGDELLTPNGTVEVSDVVVTPAADALVWELTVANDHNFTVHTGTSDLLVHNEQCIRGTRGLEHSFDRHAHEWFGRAVARDTHLEAWTELIERAARSSKTFPYRLGNDLTTGHLARIDGKWFTVYFYNEGPRAGQLASAFVPSQSQLSRALAIIGG